MNKEKLETNDTKGITLISLAVTIIVLIILAGVSIAMLTGDNGIITQANNSKEEVEISDEKEMIEISVVQAFEKDTFGELTETNFKEALKNNIGEGKYSLSIEDDEFMVKYEESQRIYEVDKDGNIIKCITGASVGDLFDETGIVDGKLHIGDFINYKAGTWTENDMTTIARTGVEPNNSTSKPSTSYQFCGFEVGGSRDENATSYYTTYKYVQDKKTSSAVTGWRLFDVSDGVITLISAGCPEDYYHPYGENYAYISEYILTGNININANASSLGLGSTYKSRDWSMYVNEEYKATTATALTRTKLDSWYAKYIIKNKVADTWDEGTFQKIYGTIYESLIDNYSYYWLSSLTDAWNMRTVSPSNKRVSFGSGFAYGVRVLVTLSSDIKVSDEPTGTKTLIDPRDSSNEYTYNVWDLLK